MNRLLLLLSQPVFYAGVLAGIAFYTARAGDVEFGALLGLAACWPVIIDVMNWADNRDR